MLQSFAESFGVLMGRGGIVMWPLLAMSVLTVAVAFERAWFWARTNRPRRVRAVRRLARLLREGQVEQARGLAQVDASVYGRVVQAILAQPRISDAGIAEAVESERYRLERFMPALSTVITVAPMLGILGTVLGIISSFEVLADQSRNHDPRLVGQGIAEALLTTAAGLVVAILVLFPYNIFRAQIDQTLGRLELLATAVQDGAPGEVGRRPAGDVAARQAQGAAEEEGFSQPPSLFRGLGRGSQEG